MALTDPVGVPAEPFARATIQGDAVVVDGDLHTDWERLLPLFFERSVIEIAPTRVLSWEGGATDRPPVVTELVTS